jgi:hypothetical protein
MDLSPAQIQVSKLVKDGREIGPNSKSAIFSVKSSAQPLKRKASALEDSADANDKQKKTRRGAGKKMKK